MTEDEYLDQFLQQGGINEEVYQLLRKLSKPSSSRYKLKLPLMDVIKEVQYLLDSIENLRHPENKFDSLWGEIRLRHTRYETDLIFSILNAFILIREDRQHFQAFIDDLDYKTAEDKDYYPPFKQLAEDYLANKPESSSHQSEAASQPEDHLKVNEQVAVVSETETISVSEAYQDIEDYFDNFRSTFKAVTEKLQLYSDEIDNLTQEEVASEAYSCYVRICKLVNLYQSFEQYTGLYLVNGMEQTVEDEYLPTLQKLLHELEERFGLMMQRCLSRDHGSMTIKSLFASAIQKTSEFEAQTIQYQKNIADWDDPEQNAQANLMLYQSMLNSGYTVEQIKAIGGNDILGGKLYQNLVLRPKFSSQELLDALTKLNLEVVSRIALYNDLITIVLRHMMIDMQIEVWEEKVYRFQEDADFENCYNRQRETFLKSRKFHTLKYEIFEKLKLNINHPSDNDRQKLKVYVEQTFGQNEVIGYKRDAEGKEPHEFLYPIIGHRVSKDTLEEFFTYEGLMEIACPEVQTTAIVPQPTGVMTVASDNVMQSVTDFLQQINSSPDIAKQITLNLVQGDLKIDKNFGLINNQ